MPPAIVQLGLRREGPVVVPALAPGLGDVPRACVATRRASASRAHADGVASGKRGAPSKLSGCVFMGCDAAPRGPAQPALRERTARRRCSAQSEAVHRVTPKPPGLWISSLGCGVGGGVRDTQTLVMTRTIATIGQSCSEHRLDDRTHMLAYTRSNIRNTSQSPVSNSSWMIKVMSLGCQISGHHPAEAARSFDFFEDGFVL